jgi:tetratricopeptide (TPR) repeat protein
VLAEKRKQNLRRVLIGVGIAALMLAVFTLVYNLFLLPDEETATRFNIQSSAENLVTDGDFEGALDTVNSGLEKLPDDPQLLLFKGVLEESLGNEEAAQEAYAEALEGFADEKTLLVSRAQLFGFTGNVQAMLADAETLIEKYPETGYGYFYKASAFEHMGQYGEAAELYDQASRVAEAADEIQLTAIARVSLANLQMNIQVPQQTP